MIFRNRYIAFGIQDNISNDLRAELVQSSLTLIGSGHLLAVNDSV